MGTALRPGHWSLSLAMSALAKRGSSTFTVALVSENVVCFGIRTLSMLKSKPKSPSNLTTASGVVRGVRPLMHASEKSAGRETLAT